MPRGQRSGAMVTLLVGLMATTSAWARQPPGQRAEPSDGEHQDRFGWSVSIDGRTAAVGAYKADVGDAFDGGAVYILERQPGSGEWLEVDKLTAPDPDSFDNFGISVSLEGGTLAIGADNDDDAGTNAGAVYVYERQGGRRRGAWELTSKLTVPDVGGAFGCNVDLDGELLAVAVCTGAGDEARAHLFERLPGFPSTWARTKIFRRTGNFYGRTVAVSGDTLLIGAALDGEVDFQAGAVYVYERDAGGAGNWGETAKLTPGAPALLASFGGALDIEGDRMLVGADGFGGFASVLEREAGSGEWVEVARLLSPDVDSDAGFGASVALSGNRALIGSPHTDIRGFSSGAAYVFERNGAGTWAGTRRFVSTDRDGFEDFGMSVALWRNQALVADPLDDVSTTQIGSVHFFVDR